MTEYGNLSPEHKTIIDELMPLTVEECRIAFDERTKYITEFNWPAAEMVKAIDAIFNLTEAVQLPYNYSKVIIEFNKQFIKPIRAGIKDSIMYREAKSISDMITKFNFKGLEQAEWIQEALSAMKPVNVAIIALEDDLAVAAEVLTAKENEHTQNLYSTLTTQWAEANEIELPVLATPEISAEPATA